MSRSVIDSRTNASRDQEALRRAMRHNRRVLWLSRHWLAIALLFLGLYAGLSMAAPVLMQAGAEAPAKLLYKMYGPMCHQFAFRSVFFFGEQPFYPREAAGADMISFEQAAAADPHFSGVDLYSWTSDLQLKAKSFIGNEQMGYKAALCERDIAIYGTMFLAGLLFVRIRHWLRPASIWLYIILGLAPLGIDGFSQMFSYPPFDFWPVRETMPAFRILTGALFGLMNVWLAFPYLERSMNETIEAVEARLAVADEVMK